MTILPLELTKETHCVYFCCCYRFLPLENNTNTILVVGGVQWMGSTHITETNKALTRYHKSSYLSTLLLIVTVNLSQIIQAKLWQ